MRNLEHWCPSTNTWCVDALIRHKCQDTGNNANTRRRAEEKLAAPAQFHVSHKKSYSHIHASHKSRFAFSGSLTRGPGSGIPGPGCGHKEPGSRIRSPRPSFAAPAQRARAVKRYDTYRCLLSTSRCWPRSDSLRTSGTRDVCIGVLNG